MTGTSHHGHHEVKSFPISVGEATLPEGWKPFAYDPTTGYVICRKYVRNEKPASFLDRVIDEGKEATNGS
jgi:hypothetical protein